MIKKIIGVFFILIGALLAINAITNIPRIQELIGETTQNTSQYESGFLYGYIAFWCLTIVASYFLLKYGIRWVRKKKLKK